MKKTIAPSKEDILQYYIKENHSMVECAAHFGISKAQFIKIREKYGIYKPKSACLTLVKATCASKAPPIPPREELETLFLKELRTKQYLAEHYQVSTTRISKWLKFYGIKKDPVLTAKTIGITTQERYGVPFFKPESAKAKARKTCLERYGVENPSFSSVIVAKIKAAESKPRPPLEEIKREYIDLGQSTVVCAEKFGVHRSTFEKWLRYYGIRKNRKQVSATRIATNLDRYGAANPLQNESVKRRMQKSCIAKYGVPNPASRNVEHYHIWSNPDVLKEFLIKRGRKCKPTLYELAEYFNVFHSNVARRIHDLHLEEYVDINPHRSAYEKELVDWIQEEFDVVDIRTSDREVLNGLEIDIYLPDYRLGIEFNGAFWHSELSPKYKDHGGRSHHHQEKSLLAESKGVFLFHIFEHEWDPRFTSKNPKFHASKENIKNRLRALLGHESRKIAARKCVVREILEQEKKDFLDANHIQGSDLKSACAFGLFFEGEMVACMSFRKPKFRQYDWELSRFCTKHGVCVQGGASKLFSHFLREKAEKGQRIVSYNDITKTKGDVYKILGFDCISIGDPNYWWINLDDYDVRSRYQEQAAGEVERMHELGYVRVCDAGTRTWLYVKP